MTFTFPEPIETERLLLTAAGAEDPDEVGVTWAVLAKASREPVGTVAVAPAETGVWRVGYSVRPEWEGKGCATEAVRAAVAWALAQPGVRTVRATIPAWNLPSIRVAERIGMAPAGTGVDSEAGEVLVYERGDAPAI